MGYIREIRRRFIVFYRKDDFRRNQMNSIMEETELNYGGNISCIL